MDAGLSREAIRPLNSGALLPGLAREDSGPFTPLPVNQARKEAHLPEHAKDGVVGARLDRLCRNTGDARSVPRIEPHFQDELAERSKRAIVCSECGHQITSDDQRIRVNGSHDHRCVNPHGLVFHIGCFVDAPGCNTTGVPTTDFTWFRGFSWSLALCRGCSTLLGWRYQGSENSFFGLILDRLLIGEPEGHP